MMKRTLAVVIAIGDPGRRPAGRAAKRRRRIAAPEAPRVALVLKTLNSPFFIDMERGAQEAAKRLGRQPHRAGGRARGGRRQADADHREPDPDRHQGAAGDALADRKEIAPAIAKANKAGIRVVVVDTRVDPQAAKDAGITIDSYIGSDNYEGGKIAGNYLLQATGGKANVGVLEGIPGHETGDQRLRGFKDAVKDAKGIKIVASQTANWERDQGFTVFQNMLEAHPEIDAVFSANDMMALGAVEAIAAKGKTGKIKVVGYDAVEDAKKAIAEGTIVASVAQFPSRDGPRGRGERGQAAQGPARARGAARAHRPRHEGASRPARRREAKQ